MNDTLSLNHAEKQTVAIKGSKLKSYYTEYYPWQIKVNSPSGNSRVFLLHALKQNIVQASLC